MASACTIAVLLAVLCAGIAQAKSIAVTWTTSNAAMAPIAATCGDVLVFKPSGFHDIQQIKSASCSAATVKTWASAPAAATSLALTAAGVTYYKCNVGSHCASGHMLLTVNTTCPKPAPKPSPKPSPKPAPVNIPISWGYGVGYKPITAKCGDTLVFNPAGFHDVTQVAAASCTAATSNVWAAAPASTTKVPLTKAGQTFYKCSVGSHCSGGAMLITVNTVC